jgi:hypothetical protein
MNDQSSVCLPTSPMATKARVALLIDGENVSPALAGRIIMMSLKHGKPLIRRVYGNAAKIGGWDAAPSFRLVHAGTGKNATDMLLCVDAMAIMLDRQADVMVIASSDGDFRHLACTLRERGFPVHGIGEGKSPESFRKACTGFVEIKVTPDPVTPIAAVAPPKLPIDDQIAKLIRAGGATGIPIVTLGGQMHTRYKVKVSKTPERNWRAYLLARPTLFECDPKGPDAKVRMKT